VIEGGSAREAIRRMLRVRPAPRRWPWWLWIIPGAQLVYVFLRLGRLWSWGVVATIIGLAVGIVPLIGVLGFELAVVGSAFGAIMGLDVGARLARELAVMPAPGLSRAVGAGRMLARTTLAASGTALVLVAIPAVIAAVRGLWVPTCDWTFGIEAYAALALATAVLAAALGHAIGVVVGPVRYWCTALALLPLPLLVFVGVWRFYAAPPVFTYNPLVGYFPGNLYDENIQLHLPLLWSRLEQLLAVVAVLAAVAMQLDVPRFRVARAPRPAGRRVGATFLFVACIAGATLLRLNAGTLGYAVDASDIEGELDGTVETAHFVIHYAHTKEIDAEIELIARDHEFRYAQVVAQLGVAPSVKLHSFYFADSEQKARWIGARRVEMAKPWRREIYLDHRSFPHVSLRHEIVHAVASEFGDWLFGVAARTVLGLPLLVSPGLIEGLAVAVDWPPEGDRTPHEAVRALVEMGAKPSLHELISLSFFGVSSARGYTTAGSFVRFLIDTYGIAAVRRVYRTVDFEGTFGKPLAALEAEWLAMIATIELPESAIETSREQFRATSVFAKPCPHAIAARREQAEHAQVIGEHARAVALMRRVCGDAPDEPQYQLALARILALGNLVEHAEADAIWAAIATDEHVTSTLRVQAYERRAQIAANHGDFATARALIAEARKLPLDGTPRRQLDAEAFALDHQGPAGGALVQYFFGRSLDPARWAALAVLAEPELAFARYLHALQKANAGDWATSASEMARALAGDLPGPAFVRNAARLLALAAYRAHDPARVEQAIAILERPEMPTVDHVLAADWRARLTFDATGKVATSR
jgi:hypothetical protein